MSLDMIDAKFYGGPYDGQVRPVMRDAAMYTTRGIADRQYVYRRTGIAGYALFSLVDDGPAMPLEAAVSRLKLPKRFVGDRIDARFKGGPWHGTVRPIRVCDAVLVADERGGRHEYVCSGGALRDDGTLIGLTFRHVSYTEPRQR